MSNASGDDTKQDITNAMLAYLALAGVCAAIVGIGVVFWILGA